MTPTRLRSALLAAAAAGLLVAAVGCGSDESGQDTTAPVAVPTITSPLSTTAPPTATGPAKQKTTKTSTGTGGSAACAIPDTYQDFKYTGIDCSAALAVAQAWDSNPNDCNTVDNPNVDEGYHRTCSVEGFTCAAKRDVHSDNRFVTCTQGGQSVRFTWLPA